MLKDGLILDYLPLTRGKDGYMEIIDNNMQSTIARAIYKMLIIREPREILLCDDICDGFHYLIDIFKKYSAAFGITFSFAEKAKANFDISHGFNGFDVDILCECLGEIMGLHNIGKDTILYISMYIKIYDDCIRKIGYNNIYYDHNIVDGNYIKIILN